MKPLILILAASLLAACATMGYERDVYAPDSGSLVERTRAWAPADAKQGPTFDQTIEGGVSITTGVGRAINQALASLTTTTNWLGGLMIVVGVGVLIARRWIPWLPGMASGVLIAGGFIVWMFPVILEQYLWLIVILGVLLAAGFAWSMKDNIQKLWTKPPETEAPPSASSP